MRAVSTIVSGATIGNWEILSIDRRHHRWSEIPWAGSSQCAMQMI